MTSFASIEVALFMLFGFVFGIVFGYGMFYLKYQPLIEYRSACIHKEEPR